MSHNTATPTDSRLIDDLVAFLLRFVRMSDHDALVFALWLIHTHCIEAADFSPYMIVTSPTKGCGKTTLAVKIAKLLAAKPLASGNISGAALFRSLADGCTFLLDETDGIWGKHSGERGEDIRTILNTGYSRGEGGVIRCVGRGTQQEAVVFAVFGAKSIAGIGRNVPETVLDRGLGIRLQKAPKGAVEKLRERRPPAEAQELREQIVAWAENSLDALKTAEPAMPEELDARGDDICEPLIAIADLLDVGNRARTAVVALRTGTEQPNTEDALRLLHDTREVFDGERMTSNDLFDALIAIEGSTWGAWWGDDRDRKKGLMRLARMLNEFDIRPSKLWFEERRISLQGYTRAQFDPAWHSYLPPREASPPTEVGRSDAPPTPNAGAAGSQESGDFRPSDRTAPTTLDTTFAAELEQLGAYEAHPDLLDLQPGDTILHSEPVNGGSIVIIERADRDQTEEPA